MLEREKVFGHKFLGLISIVVNKFWDITKINLFSIIFYLPSFVILFFLLIMAVPSDIDMLANTLMYTIEDAALVDTLVRLAIGLVFMTIPIVVFGPAVAGSANVFKNIIEGNPTHTWTLFIQTLKKHFLKAFIISTIGTIVLFISLLSLRLWLQLANKAEVVTEGLMKFLLENSMFYGVIIFVMIGFIIIFLMMHFYIYQLLIQYDLTIMQLYKYSYTFAILRFFPNLFILIACAILTILPFWIHYLFGGGMMFLVTFGLCGLIVNYYTWPAIEKHFEPLTNKK